MNDHLSVYLHNLDAKLATVIGQLDSAHEWSLQNAIDQQKANQLIIKTLESLERSLSKSMNVGGNSARHSPAIPGVSLVVNGTQGNPRSNMVCGLLQNIACLEEAQRGSATPAKLYAAMAKARQFDPDAGVSFNQLVADAKRSGFITERTAANGERYLELAM